MPIELQPDALTKLEPGALRVWWIPQIPMESFYVRVLNLREAFLLEITLASYDNFQFINNIKPHYSNAGGTQRWEENGEGGYGWFDVDWEYEVDQGNVILDDTTLQ